MIFNNKEWYSKELKMHLEKYKVKYMFLLPALVFYAVIMSQIFIFNHTFEWVTIKPIAAIGWNRILFSAFTYVTIGAVLYYLRFYKLLSYIFRNIFNDHWGYIKAKRKIWMLLIGISFLFVVPFLIRILNNILSFIYNIAVFIMYLLPSVAITALSFLVIYLFMYHHSGNSINNCKIE